MFVGINSAVLGEGRTVSKKDRSKRILRLKKPRRGRGRLVEFPRKTHCEKESGRLREQRGLPRGSYRETDHLCGPIRYP